MNGFSYSAEQIRALGQRLISHLTKTLENTKERSDWSDMMFDTLRAFRVPDVNLVCYPSARDEEEKRPEFLLDFIAYVQGKGILIAAESEWENGNLGLRHDFEKLLYVRAPIKLFLCRIDGAKTRAEELINGLYVYMRQCCSEFSPGELYIVYCVKWKGPDGLRGDVVYEIQITGEPSHGVLPDTGFQRLSSD
jgi:hypothetical protein